MAEHGENEEAIEAIEALQEKQEREEALARYQHLSMDELMTLARARDLVRHEVPGTASSQWGREFYTVMLVFADAHPTFSRFFELPAEMRNAIYAIYAMLCVGRKTYEPPYMKLPAVCQASTQLRSESLAVFLSQNRFYLDFRSGTSNVDLQEDDREWLNSNAVYVPLMRNFDLTLPRRLIGRYNEECYMTLTISPDAKSATVHPYMTTARAKQLAERVQEAINRVLSHGKGLHANVFDEIIATLMSKFREGSDTKSRSQPMGQSKDVEEVDWFD